MKKHCEYVRKHGKLKKVEDMEIELNLSEFEDLPEILENLEENSGSNDWSEKRDVLWDEFSHFCSVFRYMGVPFLAHESVWKNCIENALVRNLTSNLDQKYTYNQFKIGPKLHFGTWSEILEINKSPALLHFQIVRMCYSLLFL